MLGFGFACRATLIVTLFVCVQGIRLNRRKSAVDTMPASCLAEDVEVNGGTARNSPTPPRKIGRGYYWPRCCSKCANAGYYDEGNILPAYYACLYESNCWPLVRMERYGWKSWHIVKDGKSVLENIQNKTISAKSWGFPWGRIGLWNYTRSKKKTKTIIKVNLKEGSWNRVKLDLALRFRFGGRILSGEFKNKGRYVRAVRVVPMAYAATDRGYYLNARTGNVTVGYRGPKTNPIAEVKFKVFVSYGKKGSGGKKFKKEWRVSVLGNGQYSARKLR